MIKFGMIIDCTRQMLYVNPNGRSPMVSQSLTSFLAGRGFTRIPIRLNANHHFDVQGTLNGHATRFILDTGSANTLIDTQVAVRSGTGVTALAGIGAGGAVIADHGLVAGMLADSLTELFAARAMAYETARGIDRGLDAPAAAGGQANKVSHAQCSMAKLYCSEMAGRVADRAVQVFGGRGYMRENVAERFYRELRVERIWEGTSEIQRMIIARQMTKRTPAALA